jgi:monofunctional biosynthetic peptidoglycan transglycosylase
MKRFVLRPLRIVCIAVLWALLLSVFWVVLLGVLDPPVTWVMAVQSREQKSFAREWKDLEGISRYMPLAVIASEDQKFFDHHGFDTEAMKKAWDTYWKRRGTAKRRFSLKGGSTITQQVAKNVFLWPGRTLVRKGVEAWFTVLMEVLWTKERILEVYLNVAETGKGVFGVEAATKACFGRPASKLTQAQAAAIAVLLPSPRRYSCRNPGPHTRAQQVWVIRNMNNLGDLMDPKVRGADRESEDRSERKRQR